MSFLAKNVEFSETLLRTVINTAVDGIMITDAFGMVGLYNAACERMFGYPADEVLGKNVKMLMPARFRDEHDGYLDAYRRTGEKRIIGIGRDVMGQRKDGSQFPIRLSIGEARDGDNRFFVGIIHDISDYKETEDRMRRAIQEAESANRAKSDFLTVMSHEIRTPLHGIMSTTSLLQRTVLDEKQRHYAQAIRQSSDGLLEIVNNLLDLATIEAGKVEVKALPFEIGELIDGVEALWAPAVADKELDFFTRIDSKVPRVLIGDADRIREVLNNLVSNAIKFTQHGYIAVLVELDPSTELCEDGEVVVLFEVKDTGIGIDAESCDRYFERFEQGDMSLTREYGGSGLGLTICRELCHLLGGEIGVTSEPSKGSRFHFTVVCQVGEQLVGRLPVPESEFNLRPVATQNKHPMTVLVAEDNHNNQTIIRDILEFHGYIVDIAPNGKEAVHAVLQRPYDLVFMDVRMPVMDGLEATRQIRQKMENSSSLPIIAMTAHAMNGDRDLCLAAGMNDYVSKPFTLDQISQLVEKYAEKH